MAVHSCAECGLVHDALVAEEREPVEVTIARINADRDIQVARAAARSEADYNDTRIEVARIEAKAEVQAAEVEGEVIAAAIEASDVEAEPIEIVAPDIINDTDIDIEEDAPPPAEGSPVPETSKKSVGFGMW
jgi:uncharacterized Zn finger protein